MPVLSGPPLNPMPPIATWSDVWMMIPSQTRLAGSFSIASIKKGNASVISGPGQESGTWTPSISASFAFSLRVAFFSSSEKGSSLRRFVSSVCTMHSPFQLFSFPILSWHGKHVQLWSKCFYRDVFRQFVLHKSHDEIGHLNGWRLHRDGIHLNSRSGKILADLVQEFL